MMGLGLPNATIKQSNSHSSKHTNITPTYSRTAPESAHMLSLSHTTRLTIAFSAARAAILACPRSNSTCATVVTITVLLAPSPPCVCVEVHVCKNVSK